MHLAHKTALVTGASTGDGKGIALELARHGSDIAVNYNRDRNRPEATAHESARWAAESCVSYRNMSELPEPFEKPYGLRFWR
jgi:NAD(P)-dependent dehydrogenase (short-subunit alcohol dehydrogenase family)